MQVQLNFLIAAFGGMSGSLLNQGQLMVEIPTFSTAIPNSPQMNGVSTSHLTGACISPQMNGGSASHPTRAYTRPQMNMTNQFMHIPDFLYVNPVVLNCAVKSVIAEKLQEFKNANRPLPPDYNKPYPSWHDEMSFPLGYYWLKI